MNGQIRSWDVATTVGVVTSQEAEVLRVDDLLEQSGEAALYAVDHGDGGTQEIAYHMEALRLALFAIAVAVQELGSRLPAEGGTSDSTH
jgi:hypothetical protein